MENYEVTIPGTGRTGRVVRVSAVDDKVNVFVKTAGDGYGYGLNLDLFDAETLRLALGEAIEAARPKTLREKIEAAFDIYEREGSRTFERVLAIIDAHEAAQSS